MHNVRIGSKERDKVGPEALVRLCKLECECGKDEAEVASVLDTPRTEERRSEEAIGENPFCDRLRDSRFSRPSQSIEPEHGRPVQTPRPTFDLVQHALPRSLQATVPIPVLIPGPMSATATIEHGPFIYPLSACAKVKV